MSRESSQPGYSTRPAIVVEVVISIDVVDVVVVAAKTQRPALSSPAHHSIFTAASRLSTPCKCYLLLQLYFIAMLLAQTLALMAGRVVQS